MSPQQQRQQLKQKGSDRILNRVLKVANRHMLEIYNNLFQKYFVVGMEETEIDEASSYLSLCVLDVMRQILKRIIYSHQMTCTLKEGQIY